MAKKESRSPARQASRRMRAGDYGALLRAILRSADSGLPRVDFLGKIAGTLLEFSGCDAVEVRVRNNDQCFRCEATDRAVQRVAVQMTRCKERDGNPLLVESRQTNAIDAICRLVVEKRTPSSSACFTRGGSFWTGNIRGALPLVRQLGSTTAKHTMSGLAGHSSLAVIPLASGESVIGLLKLSSKKKDYFQQSDIDGYETIAQTLGLALASQLAHASLRERIKELTCLYGLAQLAERRTPLRPDASAPKKTCTPAFLSSQAALAAIAA